MDLLEPRGHLHYLEAPSRYEEQLAALGRLQDVIGSSVTDILMLGVQGPYNVTHQVKFRRRTQRLCDEQLHITTC
jgi:hypothetical protein